MKNLYQAVLFHPEGDFVTDFRDSKTKQEVAQAIQNMGSRWIFYPLCFVATDKTIVDAPDGLDFLIGKRITTVKQYLIEEWAEKSERITNALNGDFPLGFVYNRHI